MSPFKMEEVPKEKWNHINNGDERTEVIQVFKSHKFLVQVRVHGKKMKLVVSKIKHESKSGKIVWDDGITWDELQEIKNQCGFQDLWFCEYFPAKDKVVNVANMRHLWVMDMEPENSLEKPPMETHTDACPRCMDNMEVIEGRQKKILRTSKGCTWYQFECQKCAHIWECMFCED